MLSDNVTALEAVAMETPTDDAVGALRTAYLAELRTLSDDRLAAELSAVQSQRERSTGNAFRLACYEELWIMDEKGRR